MAVGLDPRIGTELAGYRLEWVVGRGGMGVVYLAEDLRLKRRVALKLISPELAADPQFRERFLRESELAASLDHSHVVPVYAAGETDGQLWIAMRYVEGEDLATLLARERPLEPNRALGMCTQVAGALDVARAVGLGAPDLGATDVIVAREEGREREHCYVSCLQLAEPSTERDVRSLGAILFSCLTGTLPAAVAEGAEPPSAWLERPELPESVDDVFARAFGTRGKPFGSCRELCDGARRALGLGRPWWRSPRAFVIAAVLAALLVAATVAALALTGERAAAPAATPSFGMVVRLDPRTGERIATVRMSEAPELLAAGGGAVWVVGNGGTAVKTLVRIDPTTNAVTDELDVSAVGNPWQLTATNDSVWLTNGYGTVNRLAPGQSALEPVTFVRPDGLPGFVSGLVAAAGSLWVSVGSQASPPLLLRVDPTTERVVARIEGVAFPFVATDGFLWGWRQAVPAMSAETDRTVDFVRVDTATNRTAPVLGLEWSQESFGFAAGLGAVWVSSHDEDALLQLHPATGEEIARVHVGREPGEVVVTGGAVWVTSLRDGTVARYDVENDQIKTIDVDGTPNDLVVAGGSVWVAVELAANDQASL